MINDKMKHKSVIWVLIVCLLIGFIFAIISNQMKAPQYIGDKEDDNITCTYVSNENMLYLNDTYQISKTDKSFKFENPKSNKQLIKLEVFCKNNDQLILLYTTPGKEFIEPGDIIDIDIFDKIKDDYKNFMFRVNYYNKKTKTKESEQEIEDIKIIKVDKTCYELNDNFYDKNKKLK